MKRPDVRDRPYGQALDSLAKQFKLPIVRRDSIVTQGASGTVVRQSPVAGTDILRGGVDTIVVRRVPDPESSLVAVPIVEGATYLNAIAIITRPGLIPVGNRLAPADSARARVLKQYPPPGTLVRTRTIVRLVVQVDALVQVPGVIGADTAAARKRIGDAGLSMARFTLEPNDRSAAGRVFHQDPTAGDSVKRGTSVALWVSRGSPPTAPQRAVVPLLIGLTLDGARAMLEKFRLVLGHADTVKVADGDGRVRHQEPHANDTVRVSDVVRVTIAVPQPTALVPNLSGLSRARASDTLTKTGLSMGALSFQSRATLRDDIVLSQTPAAGVRLPLGNPVNVEINAYRAPQPVRVPRLVGLSYQEAVALVRRIPLVVQPPDYRDGDQKDIVLQQVPAPGRLVPPSSDVHVVVSRSAPPPPETVPQPPPPVLVPSVVDSSLRAAVARLQSAGLATIRADTQPAPRATAIWFVGSQRPGAGERVEPNSSVYVTTVPSTVVPDLLEKSEIDAFAAAQAEGFNPNVRDRARSFWPSSKRVTGQLPPAGAEARYGTLLQLTISDPLPAYVTLAIGLASLVAVAVLAQFGGLLGPRFKTSLRTEPPDFVLESGAPAAVRAEVTLTTVPGAATTELTCPPDALILREERHSDG